MKTRLLANLVAGALALGAGGAAAGEKEPYRFLAGDTIQIAVPSHPGYDASITVQPDGRIYYPLAGEIRAVGMTVVELRERIRTALETQLEKPMVSVSLGSTREGIGWVTVLGAVNNAGRMEPKTDWTLSEALAAAGIQPDSDLTRVELIREGKPIRKVDLSRFRATGKMDEVIPVQAGDIIIVPEAPRAAVSVLGQVARPGILEWKKGMTVLDALNEAGGATPKADLRKAGIARAGVTQPLDVDALVKGAHALNQELQPGDALVIPENLSQAFVLGRVGRPNVYPLTGEQRVLDLLMEAGGPSPDANLNGARLLRMGAEGKPQVIDLNLDRMMSRGDLKGNLVVQPADILIIPEKGKKKSVREYFDAIFPFTTFYSFLTRL